MRIRKHVSLIILCFLASLFLCACDGRTPDAPLVKAKIIPQPLPATGRIVDAAARKPIPGAFITFDGDEVIQADANGLFPLKSGVRKIAARAWGYARAELAIDGTSAQTSIELPLSPVRPKALYLTVYGISSRVLREAALKLIDETELNALVIDMKGDRSIVPYKSSLPLAAAIGAQKKILIKDIGGLMQMLKDRGIYTIARVVVFKDDLLGSARPDLAIRTDDGKIWRDGENLIWVDPARKEVWDYAIGIAVEAAQVGFDEIQFDYVRFPDHPGLVFSVPNREESRVEAITEFLKEARRSLAPYNVFVSADVFGYAAWNLNDTQIGQKIDQIAPFVDYISLMLYPSGFHRGIPGCRNPVASPNRIVYLSLRRAQERTNLPAVRFRPWLQAFRDYAFDRRRFTGREIREQIRATEDFGAESWMLWNPRNLYTSDGLKKKSDVKSTVRDKKKPDMKIKNLS